MKKIDFQIINGDSLEAMRKMPSSSFDLVITSPPYNLAEGMDKKGGLRVCHAGSKWAKQVAGPGYSIGYDVWEDNLPYEKYVEWQKAVLKECFRLINETGAIFYNHKPRIVEGIARMPTSLIGDLPLRQEIIWNRGSGFNASTTGFCPMSERILVIAKRDFRLKNQAVSMLGDVWNIPPQINTDHPAPFPTEIPRKILQSTTAKKVLDPFSGSGTTGAVCTEFGCDYVGIEISKYWCDYGAARIKRAMGEPVDIPRKIVDRPLALFD